ncbi:copper homeostasis protein CutC [Microtetraspora niveoalba]|uniref:copper homeostasis protein CutC n=1 Tax=Microtetraspora niveoalba TaxID=46175 RepID=UPI00083489B4|nr:copper homeostasis protein CutC [Microtetraspora niveoalba]
MTASLLEVIALDVRDAVAAEEGGADRLEVVSDMASGGLTPSAEVVAAIAGACSLPQMVMLRGNAGFATTGEELDRLREEARALAEAGAGGFVFGFLTADGAVDMEATEALIHAVAPLPWTFHRAVDNAADVRAAWRAVRLLPNLATVLTSGSPAGVGEGLPVLRERTDAGDGEIILAGGGLKQEHVPVLAERGVRAFHVGSAVRESWAHPVDASRVRDWRRLLDNV